MLVSVGGLSAMDWQGDEKRVTGRDGRRQHHSSGHASRLNLSTHDRPQSSLSDMDGGWAKPETPPRDWKKAVLVLGLGALSWVATYVGMLELIEANMGELPLLHRVIVGCAVAMLMIMIVWLLDQIFSPAPLFQKLAYVGGYLFLTLISVGFGFGFYWKVLESKSEATRSARSAVGQVQTAMHAGTTRLEQLNATLISLRDLSQKKAQQEREAGTSCPNSRPGDGPRRKMRDADAEKFAFASQFVGGRIGTLKGELSAFDADLAKIRDDDPSTVSARDGTRNAFMRELDGKLDLAVAGFNAFRTDPQLRQIRQDLASRAERTIFPTARGGSFTCPDPQLQAALRGVVRAIDQLPQLADPQIAAVEGSEATIEAFRRLSTTLLGVATLQRPPTPDELRTLQRAAVQAANDRSSGAIATASTQTPAGLAKRDYIPLALAIFVDLCLLLVSMGRPANRFSGLVDKMHAAEKGPVIRILSRFNDIHRDADVRRNFEVFRHVVFDFHGAYYVAVPLDTPYNRVDPRTGYATAYGASEAQDLQHEAHLLANLFASFEKEKIFSRVHSPLLTAKVIRKRLARQGSKFAGSQAFRLYRFQDGAWSDIILGAVMGAARRVEQQKLQQRMAEVTAGVGDGSFVGEASAERGRGEPGDLTGMGEANEYGANTRTETRPGESHRDPRPNAFEPHAFEPTGKTPRQMAGRSAVDQRYDDPIADDRFGNNDRAARGFGNGSGAGVFGDSSHGESPDRAAFHSQFGSYARSAEQELNTDYSASADKQLPADNSKANTASAAPANNNTRPPLRETDAGSDQQNAVVIALPQRSHERTAEALTTTTAAPRAHLPTEEIAEMDASAPRNGQVAHDGWARAFAGTQGALATSASGGTRPGLAPAPGTARGDEVAQVTVMREMARFDFPSGKAVFEGPLTIHQSASQDAISTVADLPNVAGPTNHPVLSNDDIEEAEVVRTMAQRLRPKPQNG
ncbi:MAG: hypothetical protein AAGG72_02775 [Pseudomonadota bacterium]